MNKQLNDFYLPEEMTINILRSLPVKDLLRFRSVSKTWCSLIDGHYFIKEHLKNSIETNSNILVALTSLDTIYLVCRLPNPNPNPNANPNPNPNELDGYHGRPELIILGSCNGLLALMNPVGHISILNPTTKRYWRLPVTINVPNIIEIIGIGQVQADTGCGFGYDPINDDYKFVTLKLSGDVVVEVYSAKSNTITTCRRIIKDRPYYGFTFLGVLVSNALHWVVSRVPQPVAQDVMIIGAFDLVSEEFREVPMPDYTEVDLVQINLAELGGFLFLVCMYKDHNQLQPNNRGRWLLQRIEIWVMTNYGFRESWARLHVVVSSVEIGPLFYVTPVTYFDNGRKLLLVSHDQGLISYDLQTRTINNLIIPGVLQDLIPQQGLLYVESLVRLYNY